MAFLGAEILKITKQNGPTKKEMQVISFTPVKKLKKMSLFVSNLIPQSDVKQKCGGLHITLSVIHLRVGLSFFPPLLLSNVAQGVPHKSRIPTPCFCELGQSLRYLGRGMSRCQSQKPKSRNFKYNV